MKGDRFDSLARRVARASHQQVSRRSLLRALGLGGVTVASAGGLAAAQQGRNPTGKRALHQAIGAGSVSDQAFLLQYDANKIFRFVADEVVFEPYDGVLRGAEGTLRSRAGNAADKALLLGELLGASNIAVRYSIGRLSDANAPRSSPRCLWPRPMSTATRPWRLSARFPSTRTRRCHPRLPPRPATTRIWPRSARCGTLSSRTPITPPPESITVLNAALGAADRTAELPIPPLTDFQRANHVQVEYAFGADWVRLDPSLPGFEPVVMVNPPPRSAPRQLPPRPAPVSRTPCFTPSHCAWWLSKSRARTWQRPILYRSNSG